MPDYLKPLPLPDALTEEFWVAAREHRLLVQRCRACGRHQFYPRGHCVHCFAPAPEWVEASGKGRIHTFTITYRNREPGYAEEGPYVFALVDLDEGVRLAGNVVDVPLEDVAMGMPVRVVFRDVTPEVSLPQFTQGGA